MILVFILFFLIYILNPKGGYLVIFIFLIGSLFLSTLLPKGPITFPHPIFWKLILGLQIMVILAHIIGCYIDRETIRSFLHTFTPSTTSPDYKERDYSMGCSIYDKSNPDHFHNVKTILFDEFVPAHFFGWIIKGLILRDLKIATIISLGFELAERSLRQWFPNFSECWWDSFILDFLVCNGLGIYFALKIADRFPISLSNEFAIEKKSKIQYFKRFNWNPLNSLKQYICYILVIIIFLIIDVNIFSLKMIFQVRPSSCLVIFLMLLHTFMGFPAVFEIYLFSSNKISCLGVYTSTAVLVLLSELALIHHHSEGYFEEKVPIVTKTALSSLCLFVITFPFIWYRFVLKKKRIIYD